MKAAVEFSAQTREQTGTGSARDARRKGFTPINLYAKGKNNQALNIEARALSNEYFRGGFMNKVVALNVGGKTQFAIAREIQLNPVSDKIEHADFYAVDEKSVVKVRVPVHFLNTEKSIGVKRGGALNIVSHDVLLMAPVTSIPKAIDIDVADLNIGDSIHMSDLKLPAGVSPASKRDITIASIAGRGKDEDETPTGAPAAADVPASTAKAPAAGAAAPAAKPAAKK